ncbi:uroporphyrinogen decarboxylase family protein [Caldicellulosiruptoraceae bacterium PP1]
MEERATDHKNLNLAQLNYDVIRGKSGGKIIWQPRILCWYYDKIFCGEKLPEPFDGMTLPEIYRELGCSNRIYDYNECFIKEFPTSVASYSRKLSDLETEYIIETPVGKVSSIVRSNTSNYGTYPVKWWITCEDDMRVFVWLEERTTWKFDEKRFYEIKAIWGDLGLPTIFMPRVNIQSLYIDLMGVEEAIYSLYDYPKTVEAYFKVLDESHERLIKVINESPIEIINFGDNVHCGTLTPELFKKYVLPAYQRRNELLHKGGKFTHAHWDGDVKTLLPFTKECGLDGIEAITPKPQGDVTLYEVKDALGDDIFLIDGIAAILFTDTYPIEELEKQTRKVIELFAPKLILGISDEMPSFGDIERIRFVGKIVDEYNATVSGCK